MTQRIEFSEEMVGNAHPTKADTLNRFINLITAQGDIVYGTAAATAAALSKGSALALLRMNAAGTLLEWGTAGQIIFPGAAVLSADPNTLDDYEEGTFTPTILLGGTPVTSYNYQNGYYTKIGNRMFFNLYVDVNVIGAGIGAVTIGGLPGTALADARSDSSVSVFADYLTGLTGQHLIGIIAPSTSSVAIFYLLNTRATALPHTVMDEADTVFKITGTYRSAHPA